MTKQVAIGQARYRLVTAERDGRWFARAEDEQTGLGFGIECAGATDGDAVHRLSRWLEWQAAHAAALDALQVAERAYHRTMASSAFATPDHDAAAAELQAEALDVLEAARVRLDEVRAQRPDTD